MDGVTPSITSTLKNGVIYTVAMGDYLCSNFIFPQRGNGKPTGIDVRKALIDYLKQIKELLNPPPSKLPIIKDTTSPCELRLQAHATFPPAMQPDPYHAVPEEKRNINGFRILPSGALVTDTPPFDRLFEEGTGTGCMPWRYPTGKPFQIRAPSLSRTWRARRLPAWRTLPQKGRTRWIPFWTTCWPPLRKSLSGGAISPRTGRGICHSGHHCQMV